MDPKDKYTTPRPTFVRKIPRLFTASAEKFRESSYHLPTVLRSRLRFADHRQEGSSVSLDGGLVDRSKSDSFAVDDNDNLLESHALLSGSTSAPLRKSSVRSATCNEDDTCESSESASDGIEPSTVLPAAINHVDETTLYANRYEGRSVSSSIARSAEISIMSKNNFSFRSRSRDIVSSSSARNPSHMTTGISADQQADSTPASGNWLHQHGAIPNGTRDAHPPDFPMLATSHVRIDRQNSPTDSEILYPPLSNSPVYAQMVLGASRTFPGYVQQSDESVADAWPLPETKVLGISCMSTDADRPVSRGRQLISQRSNNASWDKELPEVLLRDRRSTRIEREGRAPHSLKEPDSDLSAKGDLSHDSHHCTSISSPSPTTEASAFDLRSPTFSSFTVSSSGITTPFRLSDQSIPPTNHLAYSNDADADAALDHISEELGYFSDEHDYTSEPALCLPGLYASAFDNATAAAKRHGAVFDRGRSAPSLQRYGLLRGGGAEAEEEMARAVPSKAEEPLPQIALTREMSMMEEIAGELECLGGATY
ncbi:hypothetical protein LTR04_001757 [Oleoguttula sp. CCFEE 6159]|nr:hypothetical protein LTR04_001757 [Oleoguttula sp. CCFEE 6159]